MTTDVKLNEEARDLVDKSTVLARNSGSHDADTLHLLASLLDDRSTTAYRILTNIDVNFSRARSEVHSRLVEHTHVADPATMRLAKVLEIAAQEAERLGDPSIGSEHVLLGLLCDDELQQNAWLEECGMKKSEARQELMLLRGGPEGEAKPLELPNPTTWQITWRLVVAFSLGAAAAFAWWYVYRVKT